MEPYDQQPPPLTDPNQPSMIDDDGDSKKKMLLMVVLLLLVGAAATVVAIKYMHGGKKALAKLTASPATKSSRFSASRWATPGGTAKRCCCTAAGAST